MQKESSAVPESVGPALEGPSLPQSSPERNAWGKANICILFSFSLLVGDGGFHYFHPCTSYTHLLILSSLTHLRENRQCLSF